MKAIPTDSEGKTAGQRDREAQRKIERDRWIVGGVVLALVGFAGAVLVFGLWHALAR